MDDFLHGIRLTFYGSHYNTAHSAGILKQMLLQSLHMEFDLVPLAVLVLASLGNPRTARTARVWLLAFLGAWFYKPISPVPFPYLELPLRIVGATQHRRARGAAKDFLRARRSRALRGRSRYFWAVGLGASARPRDVQRQPMPAGGSRLLRRGGTVTPPRRRWGSIHRPPVRSQGALAPPGSDYRGDASPISRTHTSPATRVANLLHVVPALNGPVARLTSLPAESLAWLAVHPEDERLFAPALQQAPAGSLVVWTPEKGQFVDIYGHYAEVERLAPVVRRHYVPIAQFGDIEVWQRTGGPTM